MTAPDAWRAISPVSSVTVCWPYWKLFVTLLNIGSILSFFADRVSGAVVHLTTGGHCQPTAQLSGYRHLQNKQALKTRNARIS
jgi:hypothetical protein